MTRLELAICEAENSGEIDLDTRDTMLSVLTEGQGTAQYRAVERLKRELEDCDRKYDRLYDMRDKFESEGNKKMANAVDKKLGDLVEKMEEIRRKMRRTDPEKKSQLSVYNGKRASEDLNLNKRIKKKYGTSAADQDSTLTDFKKHVARGKQYVDENPWRGNSGRNDREPGRYKTTSGLKESVLEDIYEAELNGEITPEERQSLIDYMNI